MKIQRSVKKLHLAPSATGKHKIQLNLPKRTQLYLLRISVGCVCMCIHIPIPSQHVNCHCENGLNRKKKRKNLGSHVHTHRRWLCCTKQPSKPNGRYFAPLLLLNNQVIQGYKRHSWKNIIYCILSICSKASKGAAIYNENNIINVGML